MQQPPAAATDHPSWQPDWRAYAEYGGHCVVLREAMPSFHDSWCFYTPANYGSKFVVVRYELPLIPCPWCGKDRGQMQDRAWIVSRSDERTDAEEEFRLATLDLRGAD